MVRRYEQNGVCSSASLAGCARPISSRLVFVETPEITLTVGLVSWIVALMIRVTVTHSAGGAA
ncbi:MAG: hypothetical protein M2R45_04684 [Verrucomicrobia subdivision 3 bacterium]|nr:hypothetical protein [Limisphaerales bacterium]MCS1416607.1 hypothetical protein [Limisphaerales bacterium]